MTKGTSRNRFVTPEEFIRIWQTSDSLNQFAEKSGMTPSSARTRYHTYLKNGIMLKKYPRQASGKRLDYVALNELALSLA